MLHEARTKVGRGSPQDDGQEDENATYREEDEEYLECLTEIDQSVPGSATFKNEIEVGMKAINNVCNMASVYRKLAAVERHQNKFAQARIDQLTGEVDLLRRQVASFQRNQQTTPHYHAGYFPPSQTPYPRMGQMPAEIHKPEIRQPFDFPDLQMQHRSTFDPYDGSSHRVPLPRVPVTEHQSQSIGTYASFNQIQSGIMEGGNPFNNNGNPFIDSGNRSTTYDAQQASSDAMKRIPTQQTFAQDPLDGSRDTSSATQQPAHSIEAVDTSREMEQATTQQAAHPLEIVDTSREMEQATTQQAAHPVQAVDTSHQSTERLQHRYGNTVPHAKAEFVPPASSFTPANHPTTVVNNTAGADDKDKGVEKSKESEGREDNAEEKEENRDKIEAGDGGGESEEEDHGELTEASSDSGEVR